MIKTPENKTNLRVLGIDPGTATIGWGVVDFENKKLQPVAFGAIQTSKNKNTIDRLKEIADDLGALINEYKPDEVAIEELFFFKNLKTVIKVAQARGAMLLVLGGAKFSVFEYTPLQIKQALTGYGRAEKAQVQMMVKDILKLKSIPKPDDAADALAVAVCHHHCRKLCLITNEKTNV